MDTSSFYFVAVVCATAYLGALILSAWYRKSNKPTGPLIPNQLLTTYPIILVKQRPSIYYPGPYWNHLKYFLFEHGYDVKEKSIAEIQTEEVPKAHYFLNYSDLQDNLKFFQENLERIKSLNYVHSKSFPKENFNGNALCIPTDIHPKTRILLALQRFLIPFSKKDFAALGCFQELPYYLQIMKHINHLAEEDLVS